MKTLSILFLGIVCIAGIGDLIDQSRITQANLDAINKALNICHFEDDSFGTCYPDNPTTP